MFGGAEEGEKEKITSLNVFFLTPLGDFFSSIKTGINF